MGLGIFAIGLLPPEAFYVMLGLFLSIGIFNAFAALIQSTVEPGMQGQVFSLMSSLAQGMSPLALLIAGPLADLLAGAGCLSLVVGALFLPPLMRLEETRPEKALSASGP